MHYGALSASIPRLPYYILLQDIKHRRRLMKIFPCTIRPCTSTMSKRKFAHKGLPFRQIGNIESLNKRTTRAPMTCAW